MQSDSSISGNIEEVRLSLGGLYILWPRLTHLLMKHPISLLAFFCCVVLSGCAGTVQYTRLPTITDSTPVAKLYFIRPSRMLGAATSWDVRVDGFLVAAVGNGKHAVVTVPAGLRSIGTRDTNMTLQVSQGETQYWVLDIVITSLYRSGEVHLNRCAESEGRRLLAETTALN